MQLLFKQRMFSWFDSYDIYNAAGDTVFVVKGKMAWGHRLEIYDARGQALGTVKQEIFSLRPRFALYEQGRYVGQIRQEFTLFKPVFTLDHQGWTVKGDLWQWDYQVVDSSGGFIMQASKQLFNWTDTYVIDVADPQNQLAALMIVLAIDAAKCSRDG